MIKSKLDLNSKKLTELLLLIAKNYLIFTESRKYKTNEQFFQQCSGIKKFARTPIYLGELIRRSKKFLFLLKHSGFLGFAKYAIENKDLRGAIGLICRDGQQSSSAIISCSNSNEIYADFVLYEKHYKEFCCMANLILPTSDDLKNALIEQKDI